MNGYWRYWGKAEPGQEVWHPLACHSLDVAAVCECILEGDALLRKRLADLLETPEDRITPWLITLIALHDVGKFAESFQNLRQDLKLRPSTKSSNVPYCIRHDELGRRFLTEKGLFSLSSFSAQLTAEHGSEEDLLDLWTPAVTAVTGHHGRPTRSDIPWALGQHFPPSTERDAREFITDVGRLLGCAPIFDLDDYERHFDAQRRTSWLVAGLAVVSDWLGSNTKFFRYQSEPRDLGEYWQEVARPAAREAVCAAKIIPPTITLESGLFSEFFPDFEATPLQDKMSTIELGAGPKLWIVEELTGGGKTEAAMVLAGRLLAAGEASGVFFALPTMATANAMFGRVDSLGDRLFESSIEVILAHSGASLARRMRVLDAGKETKYTDGEPSASTAARSWLTDSRKSALLAHLGVGTIDQALLAVLPAAHQSLRLLGLCRHVLVVDEVHACDAYMLGELRRLLEFQAGLGGHVILLSATLPARVRCDLEKAFRSGVGMKTSPRIEEAPYPLVTAINATQTRRHAPTSRTICRRRVEVERFDLEDDVVARIVATAEEGRCVAWIRNTVDDAMEAWQMLRARLGADRVILFHARFALGDRLATERLVVRRFGKYGKPAERAGHVVVSTQVLEQSLDVDFDWMVTDLAPMDLIIQRAGRLMRHPRDGNGAVFEGPDARGKPRLGLLSPSPLGSVLSDWPAKVLPRTGFVYRDPAILWRTAAWLEQNRGFQVPDDARNAIETVYADESPLKVPDSLIDRSEQAEGDRLAQAGTASQSVLTMKTGYSADGAWFDDENIRTRLGERTVTVRLVKDDGFSEPRPWWDDPDPVVAWGLSELTVVQRRISDEVADPLSSTVRAQMPDQGRNRILLFLRPDADSWLAKAKSVSGPVTVRYNHLLGLQFSED
ncbi:MAG: CRISPR-associated helicase Cas3' [Planctomycetota bacterium]|nr:MAG: CRISPR-associated helicase Cas3' [Planctomycetota bacterium]